MLKSPSIIVCAATLLSVVAAASAAESIQVKKNSPIRGITEVLRTTTISGSNRFDMLEAAKELYKKDAVEADATLRKGTTPAGAALLTAEYSKLITNIKYLVVVYEVDCKTKKMRISREITRDAQLTDLIVSEFSTSMRVMDIPSTKPILKAACSSK